MQKFLFQKLYEDCKSQEDFYIYIELIQGALTANRIRLQKTDPDYIYYEGHHILPRSLYPNFLKTPENLVLLTAQEHYLAHKYLAAMFPDTTLVFAFWRLCTDNKGRHVSAEDYEAARLKIAEKSSIINKGRRASEETREKLRSARLGYKFSEETKHKISISNLGKSMSAEARRKMSEAKLGKPGNKWSDESRARLSELYTGIGNPMYGKNIKDYMSEEAYDSYRKHLSEALIGHEVLDETKRKIGEKSAERCKGAGNPRARRVLCVEDNIIFGTITECGQYYGHSRRWANDVVKAGYSKTLNKHFKIIEKDVI